MNIGTIAVGIGVNCFLVLHMLVVYQQYAWH